MEIKKNSLFKSLKGDEKQGQFPFRLLEEIVNKARKKVIRKRRVIKNQQRIFVNLAAAEKNKRAPLVFL